MIGFVRWGIVLPKVVIIDKRIRAKMCTYPRVWVVE